MATASNLKTRILSALVLGPVAIGAIYLGGIAFFALIVIAFLVAQYEWLSLVAPKAPQWISLATYAALLGIALVAFLDGITSGLGFTVAVAILLFIVVRLAAAPGSIGIALGIVYVGGTMEAIVWLRELPGIGFGLTCFLFALVWATDVGAYCAGRALGGPKLAPRLSPNKTWAGLIGGMISAGIVGWLVALGFSARLAILAGVIAAVLALIAQMGDLFESTLKRRAGVKDSGTLIPGHGGVLDRIDGLMAAALVLTAWQLALGESLAWW
ncbi:MAG: phosphatidate cytidylyltransferase [Pseudomonadota bacterium]